MPTSLSYLNNEHVIIIYEGSSEEAIYDLLFENKCLCYEDSPNLIRKSTGTRNSKKFAKENLQRDYGEEPINIIRILDSKNERFKLPKTYDKRMVDEEIKKLNIITSPEIEILVILNENDYNEFSKSKYNNDAASFCKDKYKYKKIKSYDFIYHYFKDIDILINAIKKYNTITKNSYLNLYDLLNSDIR